MVEPCWTWRMTSLSSWPTRLPRGRRRWGPLRGRRVVTRGPSSAVLFSSVSLASFFFFQLLRDEIAALEGGEKREDAFRSAYQAS